MEQIKEEMNRLTLDTNQGMQQKPRKSKMERRKTNKYERQFLEIDKKEKQTQMRNQNQKKKCRKKRQDPIGN